MTGVPEDGIRLSDAIDMLRTELLEAHARGAASAIQFPVQSMSVELKMTATRTADGKAGFAVPIINVEVGGSMGWQSDMMQTVTVSFGPPVDDSGNPVPVAGLGDEPKG